MKLLAVMEKNPYQSPPAYEKLQGDLKGSYSRRINQQHRIVYDVLSNDEGLKDEDGAPYLGVCRT